MREMWFFLAAALVVAADQISKYFVRANMSLGQSIPEEGFFRFTYSANTGGVWGWFQNHGVVFIAFSIIAVIVILLVSRHRAAQNMLVKVSLGLLLGGSIGNLIDRIRFGEVTDFINVGIGSHRWPYFNLADSSMVVGVTLLIIYILFQMWKEWREEKRVEPKV